MIIVATATTVYSYDAEYDQVEKLFSYNTPIIKTVAVCLNDSVVVVGTIKNDIDFRDAQSGEYLSSLALDGDIQELRVSQDGSVLAVILRGGHVRFVNTLTYEIVSKFDVPDLGRSMYVWTVIFSGENLECMIKYENNFNMVKLCMCNLRDGTETFLGEFASRAIVNGGGYIASRDEFVLSLEDLAVVYVNRVTGEIRRMPGAIDGRGMVNDYVLSPDESMILVNGDTLTKVDLASNTRQIISRGSSELGIAFSHDSKWLVRAYRNIVSVWEIPKWRERRTIEFDEDIVCISGTEYLTQGGVVLM
jgi:hypothetical protein